MIIFGITLNVHNENEPYEIYVYRHNFLYGDGIMHKTDKLTTL